MSKKHTRKKNFNDIGNVFNDIDYEDEYEIMQNK